LKVEVVLVATTIRGEFLVSRPTSDYVIYK